MRDYLFTLEMFGILSPYLVLWDALPRFRSIDITVWGRGTHPTET